MSKLILIVENDKEHREMLQEIVEGLGYEAVVVGRATAALKAIEEHLVSLILLDIKMPRVHGHHFLRYMRKQGKRIPVIAVSGYLTPEVFEVLQENDVRQVIIKPFTVQRLTQTVFQVLEDDQAQE